MTAFQGLSINSVLRGRCGVERLGWLFVSLLLAVYILQQLADKQAKVMQSYDYFSGVERVPFWRPVLKGDNLPSEVGINDFNDQPAGKGLYNFTVVIMLVDIGRGKWKYLRRSFESYIRYMERVMQLDVNMAIFVDARGRPHVERMRRGREKHTFIVDLELQDLPSYKLRPRIQEIMNSEEFKRDNYVVAKNKPQALYPDYVVQQWGKMYCVHEAIRWNPFRTDFFIWLDAGYAHGDPSKFPPDNIWVPKNLFQHADKVTFISFDGIEDYRNVSETFFKLGKEIIQGYFFAGGRGTLEKLYALQQEVIEDWMKKGIVSADQPQWTEMYYRQTELFRLVKGDWFDAFRLFN